MCFTIQRKITGNDSALRTNVALQTNTLLPDTLENYDLQLEVLDEGNE